MILLGSCLTFFIFLKHLVKQNRTTLTSRNFTRSFLLVERITWRKVKAQASHFQPLEKNADALSVEEKNTWSTYMVMVMSASTELSNADPQAPCTCHCARLLSPPWQGTPVSRLQPIHTFIIRKTEIKTKRVKRGRHSIHCRPISKNSRNEIL